MSVEYILDTDEGELGICGLTSVHERLAELDPATRQELDRLVELRTSLRDSWRTAAGAGSGVSAPSMDFDDLPF